MVIKIIVDFYILVYFAGNFNKWSIFKNAVIVWSYIYKYMKNKMETKICILLISRITKSFKNIHTRKTLFGIIHLNMQLISIYVASE